MKEKLKYIGLALLYTFIFFFMQLIVGIASIIFFVFFESYKYINQNNNIDITNNSESLGLNKLDYNTIVENANRTLETYSNIILLIAGIIALLLASLITKSFNKSVKETVNLKKPYISQILIATFLGLSFNYFVSATLVFLNQFSFMESIMKEYSELTDSIIKGPFLFSLLCVGILVPFIEEFFFRGVIFSALKKAFNPSIAIFLQALLFGIVHFNVIQSSYAFILGIALGILVQTTKSIWTSFFTHAAINSSSVILSFIYPDSSGIEESIPIYVPIIAFLFSLTLLILAYKNQKRLENNHISL